MSEPLLRIEDLHKSYAGTEVLKGISFDLERGETKVLIGPSGSGKSTLLRCVNHLTRPDRGRIVLDGDEVVDNRINAIRATIGFVFQDFNLFTHLRALDNVAVGLWRVRGMDRRSARERAARELERVGLANRAEAYPAELSGGQQQRVSIARALAMDPRIILFDEPTSALDPELTEEVVEVMRQLAREGMTMLVVSHEMGFARSAADEIIFMDHGVIVEEGPPEKLFRDAQHARTRDFLRIISGSHAQEEGAS